jgi:LacI family transcriptional regulator
MKKTTVYDVAREAGVSTATVSFSFSQPQRVKSSTLEKVLATAKELGYVPSASARGLARGQTGAIGLYSYDFYIDPNTANFENNRNDFRGTREFPLYIDEVQRGFEIECWSNGKSLLLGAASFKGSETLTSLAGRVDGIGIFQSQIAQESPLQQLSRNQPVVLLSEKVEDLPIACVTCDNDSGMKQLIEHLVNVHHITNAAFISSYDGYDIRQRYKAFQKYTQLYDLSFHKSYVEKYTNTSAPSNTDEDFLSKLKQSIKNKTLPEALICSNDELAFDVLDILNAKGYRVPEDIIVTGFDGIQASLLSTPELTTVLQPMQRMGQLAARLLIQQNGKPWEKPAYFELPTRLSIRHSCGC